MQVILNNILIKKNAIFLFCIFLLLGCTAMISEPPDSVTDRLIDEGVVFMRMNRLDLAEASFRVASERQQIPIVYDALGCLELRRKNYSRARYYFQRVLDWFPDYTEIYWHLAYLEEEEGDLQAAESFYQKAINADPGGARERNNFGVFLRVKTGNFSDSEAKSYIQDAFVLSGDIIPAGNLGDIYEQTKAKNSK